MISAIAPQLSVADAVNEIGASGGVMVAGTLDSIDEGGVLSRSIKAPEQCRGSYLGSRSLDAGTRE